MTPGAEAALAQQLAMLPGESKPGAKTVKDVQLERAMEILKGICLFREAKSK